MRESRRYPDQPHRLSGRRPVTERRRPRSTLNRARRSPTRRGAGVPDGPDHQFRARDAPRGTVSSDRAPEPLEDRPMGLSTTASGAHGGCDVADIITDTTLVTVDARHSVHHGAGIAIADGRIAAIGTSGEILDRFPHTSPIDGRGKVIRPGLANTHAHLYLTIARGLFEDYPTHAHPPYDDVNRPPIPRLSREERSIMAQLGALEALRSGTTFVLDDTLNAEDYVADLVPSGLRIMFADRTWHRRRARVILHGAFAPYPAA